MIIDIPFSCGDTVYAVRPQNMYNKEAYIYRGIVVHIEVKVDRDNVPKVMAHIRDLKDDLKYPTIIYQLDSSIYATLDEAKSANQNVLVKI